MNTLITNPADEVSTTTEEIIIPANETTQALTDNTIKEPVAAVLPNGYLCGGYYATTDKGAIYLRAEYVGKYAEELACQFSCGMKTSDFTALFRELKRSKKKTLPYEARQTAIFEMLPKALVLVNRKKAPMLLVDFIRANSAAVCCDDDAMAFLRHTEAIAAYMSVSAAV